MLRLIKQSLTVEIAYEGKVEPTTVGVPQGSPITPLTQKVILAAQDFGAPVLGRSCRNRNAVANGDGILADQEFL
jgi:hypothetical protein